MMIFDYLNILCGVVIFVFCACRLGAKQWTWQQIEFWANLILLPSAVAIIITPLPSNGALVFRLGVAVYFAAQTWKIWRLQHYQQTKQAIKSKKSRKKSHK